MQWESRPQAAADVHTLMQNLQSYWMARPRQRPFRRVIALCDKFLPTVDTHTVVLSVLPDGARYYTPLLYAVLQSVIKVGHMLELDEHASETLANNPSRSISRLHQTTP